MHEPPATPAGASNAQGRTAADTRLRGRWLVLARAVAVVRAAFGVGSFFVRLPGHFSDLQAVFTGPVCAYGQVSPEAVRSFQMETSPLMVDRSRHSS